MCVHVRLCPPVCVPLSVSVSVPVPVFFLSEPPSLLVTVCTAINKQTPQTNQSKAPERGVVEVLWICDPRVCEDAFERWAKTRRCTQKRRHKRTRLHADVSEKRLGEVVVLWQCESERCLCVCPAVSVCVSVCLCVCVSVGRWVSRSVCACSCVSLSLPVSVYLDEFGVNVLVEERKRSREQHVQGHA